MNTCTTLKVEEPRSLPRATRHLKLALGSLGEDAAVIGLNRIVVDAEFGAAAVDERLEAVGAHA